MPILPDADRAWIESAKLSGYLLNPRHKDGGPKAVFFIGAGFNPDDVSALSKALLDHALMYDAKEVATRFGKRYVVEGPIRTPSGRSPWVRAVWEVDDGPPRLITAVPMEPRS
jgi:hypothetical protein